MPVPCFPAMPAGGEAKQLRLVSQTYASQEALLAGANAMARVIAAKSPLAVCGTKRVLLYQRRAEGMWGACAPHWLCLQVVLRVPVAPVLCPWSCWHYPCFEVTCAWR